MEQLNSMFANLMYHDEFECGMIVLGENPKSLARRYLVSVIV